LTASPAELEEFTMQTVNSHPDLPNLADWLQFRSRDTGKK
jgi:hypothetical protein